MPGKPKAESSCATALTLFLAGDWEAWRGLPADCGHSELSTVLNDGDEFGNGMLSKRPVRFRAYTADRRKRSIWAWFDDRENAFLLTETIVRRTNAEALLQRLGEPGRKIDQLVGRHADAHQWVYAERGLTLFVRENDWSIAAVAVYAPSSPNYYERYLGAHDQRRYGPGDA